MTILKAGQEIQNAYKVERFLGEGAFAEVYRVRHRFLGRQAMKVFKTTGLSLKETEELLEEAILLSKIGHPNIIRVFNADVMELQPSLCGFFTMEYIAGGTLDRYWRSFENQFIPIEHTVDIAKQICQGLAVAHSSNPPIIHRDIKPLNILVGYVPEGVRVRISDFGLAKKVNPLTLIASARGTLAFKAPEFLEKMDSTSSDIWAVGTTIYLLLTDQLPYTNLDEDEFVKGKHWERPIIPPSGLNIDIDPTLDSIVLKTLAVNPDDRYNDAMELLEDLSRWKNRKVGKLKPISPHSSKSALGERTPLDKVNAEKMIKEAMKMSAESGRLMEAADMLEEAVNAAPEFRQRYKYQISLWRRGITM